MAIITMTTVDRNQPAQFILNKAELVAEVSNVYFQDTDNWSRVDVSYSSSTSNQVSVLTFNTENTSPTVTSNFFISDTSQGNFLIRKITIRDYDGGFYELTRNDLIVADFDVIIPFVRNLINSTFDENIGEYTWGNLTTDSLGTTINGDTGFGFDMLNLSLPGILSPKVYKLRIFIAAYSGSLDLEVGTAAPSWMPDPVTGQVVFSASQLSSAVGGYLETYIPLYDNSSNQYLYFYNSDPNGIGSITMSKIELFEDTQSLPERLGFANAPNVTSIYEDNFIKLMWNLPPAYTNPYFFRVERQTYNQNVLGSKTILADNLVNPQYIDITAQPGTRYRYTVGVIAAPQFPWAGQVVQTLLDVEVPVFVRSFFNNSGNLIPGEQLYNDNGSTIFIGGDTLYMSNWSNPIGALYAYDDYGSGGIKDFTFTGSYRVAIDYINLTSSTSPVPLKFQGPFSTKIVNVGSASGTAVVTDLLLSENGEEGFYFRFEVPNTSIEITQIRFFQSA